MKKPFTFLVTVFLWIVALAHIARLVFCIPISIGNIQVPIWISIVPIIVLPIIAIMLRKESRTP